MDTESARKLTKRANWIIFFQLLSVALLGAILAIVILTLHDNRKHHEELVDRVVYLYRSAIVDVSVVGRVTARITQGARDAITVTAVRFPQLPLACDKTD